MYEIISVNSTSLRDLYHNIFYDPQKNENLFREQIC